MAHRFGGQNLERRLEHGKRRGGGFGLRLARRRSVGAGASGAGAFIAQVHQRVFAAMAVFPIDLDALGLRNGDVFRFGG